MEWTSSLLRRSDPLFRQMSRTEKLIWVKGFLFVVQQSLIASTFRQIHYQHKKVTSHSVHQIANDCGQNIQILFTDSILQNAKAKKKQILNVMFCQKGRQTWCQIVVEMLKSPLKIIWFLIRWRRVISQWAKNKYKINKMLYSGSRVNLTGLYFKGFILALTSHV